MSLDHDYLTSALLGLGSITLVFLLAVGSMACFDQALVSDAPPIASR